MSRDIVRYHIILTTDQERWLRLRAAVLGVTKADLIRALIERERRKNPDPMKERVDVEITAEALAAELINRLDPSDENLEDIGYVIDNLSDAERPYSREQLEAVPTHVWERAWDVYDKHHGRQ